MQQMYIFVWYFAKTLPSSYAEAFLAGRDDQDAWNASCVGWEATELGHRGAALADK